MRAKILIADDEREVCELLEPRLVRQGYDVTIVTTGEEALAKLETDEYDVLLSDQVMGNMTGVELCGKALALRPDLCVIILTGFGTMDLAVEALRSGAYDFVTKPVALEVLALTLKRAVERQLVGRDLRHLGLEEPVPELGMVGGSAAMRQVHELVRRVAGSETTVLIQGETGTGKERVARAIHDESKRKGAFVAINCSAMPQGLLESELFGHQAGAFTDARVARPGLFVEASGGTVFLDEIGEMPLGMQGKLLRALQERTVRPLGSPREIRFDARVIAATNKSLAAEVEAKRFRADLFYRVNVVTIQVPPLRARPDDILPLTRHFLKRLQRTGHPPLRLNRAVAGRLVAYPWPGNIRELENCVERAAAFARFDELTVDDLPPELQRVGSSDDASQLGDATDGSSMELVERNYIRKVMEAVEGNLPAASRILGFDLLTLRRKLSMSEAADPSGGSVEPAAGRIEVS